MANGFLERHRSVSIVAFLGFLVLLGLSCVYLGLTGALAFIPPAALGPLDLSLLTGDRCEPPCWQGPTPEDPTTVALRCAYLRLTRLVRGVGTSPPGSPGPLALSLLTGDPCEPPCWQGLTPGESTEQDVYEFVQTSELVDRCGGIFCSDITTAAAGVVGVSIQWDSTTGRGGGDFHVEGGVLEDMILYPDHGFTLGGLIRKYGDPEKYAASLQGFERRWVDVTLYYPTHGFTSCLILRPGDTFQPESTVNSVWYLRAAPLERFLELDQQAGYTSSTPEEALQYMHDWQGYGRIEVD